MGPTASGKTGLAVELTQRFPFEIVNVDSAQVYRQMDIGTAKPDRKTQRRAPHHLIDIVDPIERYSAARFCEDANELLPEIYARGNVPLLTGGTMLIGAGITVLGWLVSFAWAEETRGRTLAETSALPGSGRNSCTMTQPFLVFSR